MTRKRTEKPPARGSVTAHPQRSSMSQNVTKKREEGAQLVAEDKLSDEHIAAKLGITRRTLARWKEEPAFIARVQEITEAYAQKALKHRIARKECRISVLCELHDKMLTVFQERAQSPEMDRIPGGKTGLLTRTLKGIGKGEDFQVVEEYEVDTGTIREIRALQQQVAEELGQRIERTAIINVNELWEHMTEQELERYASEGVLPDWFQETLANPSGVKAEVAPTEAKNRNNAGGE